MSNLTQRDGILVLVHIVLAVIAVSLFSSVPAYADEPVTSKLEAYIVELDADGNEVFTPASKVLPGGTIEYRIQYTNNTSEVLRNFVVNGDIPDQTEYLGESDSANLPAKFQAYVEDIGWVDMPAFRSVTGADGTVQKIPIKSSEFTQLHWTLTAGLAPEASVRVAYRVKVNQ